MTREQFLERFSRLADTDEAGLSALAKEVLDDAREAARATVDVWVSNPAQAQKAGSMLRALDELSFVPLTERGDPPDPQHRVWLLRMAGTSHTEFRGKLIAMIDRLMGDRRKPPARKIAGPPLEESPGIPRVCDEAYLAHRQLLNFAESREQFALNERAFLALPEGKRDEEIVNLKKSGTWTRLASKP